MSSENIAAELGEFARELAKAATKNTVRRRGRGSESIEMPQPSETKHQPSQLAREMWAIYNGRMYSACETAAATLPPGQYTVEQSNQIGIYFNRADVNLDELIMLPDSVSDTVLREIQTFWTKEAHFRKFGFLWKRGVLLWGPPGSGKTSTLQMIAKHIIDNGGIAVYVSDPNLGARGLKMLREVEPHRPIVIMLEDVDAIVEEYNEAELLALMDGELQIDNVVFIATTNYPERLDPRFVCRPSRFDIVRKIGMPNEDARRLYFITKNQRLADVANVDELDKWVDSTKNFSIAHLKELIVSVEVFEVDFNEAVKRLRTLTENMPKSSDSDIKGSFGFST
jgi:SpoVK/Ycf46/Vps4 family AAA+-type ATPase